MTPSPPAIRVGDLVAVVKSLPCCGANSNWRRFFTVLAIQEGFGFCIACGGFLEGKYAVMEETSRTGRGHAKILLSRLKRIDPLLPAAHSQSEITTKEIA
jgi:hypothetical protein